MAVAARRRLFCLKRIWNGAGDGNRTHVCSLGSCRSTIELHPHPAGLVAQAAVFVSRCFRPETGALIFRDSSVYDERPAAALQAASRQMFLEHCPKSRGAQASRPAEPHSSLLIRSHMPVGYGPQNRPRARKMLRQTSSTTRTRFSKAPQRLHTTSAGTDLGYNLALQNQ
jgi:hypothetical protein